MLGAKTPDITPAQILAIVGWVVAQAIAFGLLPTQDAQIAISAGATLLAVALKFADSHLRGKRAIALATVQAGATAIPPAQ